MTDKCKNQSPKTPGNVRHIETPHKIGKISRAKIRAAVKRVSRDSEAGEGG